MKKINMLIGVAFAFFGAALLAAGIFLKWQGNEKSREYLVEVNRIMRGMEEQKGFFMPDLHEMEQIVSVSFLEYTGDTFLENQNMVDWQRTENFFREKNGYGVHIEPLIVENQVLGLVRFEYQSVLDMKGQIWLVEGMLASVGIFVLGLLFYIRNKIIKPFLVLRDMPYELSKGRLGAEIEENKDRFFGKFVWGISMLKDNLRAAQMKALRLEKEKKLLLLSVSHDIKTPLNSIKLYAKAMEEGLYDTPDKQINAAKQIEYLSEEIEDFVKEIVKTSSEEVVHVEIENSEFYLEDFVEMIRQYYAPKCKLVMTELHIGGYENKLLKGSRDSAFEVLENIMENAFKYGDGRRIEITFYEEEYCQLVKIRNTGTPVNAEEIPHLFDSFYRGSNAAEKAGNGLGLYICRKIMQKMEGEIFAQREADGMSFQMVFSM
ncbi:MAG: HAMP domain-containing sensor histidine kinase [Eubacteriales bacterium]|nr:HAMP domain-containing sensor histidine kinase [Eubacteriales bacterium]